MRALGVLILVAGCDVIFPLREPTQIPGDGADAGDAGIDAPMGCVDGQERDDFDNAGAPPCGDGFIDATNGMLARLNDTLVMTPNMAGAALGTDISCSWQDINSEVFVEVVTVLAVDQAYTLVALTDGTTFAGIRTVVAGGDITIELVVLAGVVPNGPMGIPYEPTAMRWWRVRVDANTIVGEVSADGLGWSPIGTVPSPFPSNRDLVGSINAGQLPLPKGGSPPGTAVFDNFNTCPDR